MDSFRHRGKTDRITQQLDVSHPEYLPRVEVITHDLKAPFSEQMVNKLGYIDYIVSIASESHVDRSITDPRDFIENNVQIILTLLEYARENSVEKFLHISTDEVFGNAPEGYNHKEGDPHRPSNPYSASKAAQEDICYSYWRTYGIPIVVTNTMNIIGELQDVEKFIPMTIKKVQAGERVPIHASADGRVGTRFYLHARNQADALMYPVKERGLPNL
jgi:dTDP-glucose 4,6-dehydratase